MTDEVVKPAAFWDAKILIWDRDRYEAPAAGESIPGRLRHRAGSSIRMRMELACARLAPVVVGRRVVELGCGTGRIAPRMLAAGASSYLGIDLSAAAVEHAREQARRLGCGERAHFEASDVTRTPLPDADVIVSLGLLDWLDDEAIARVFAASRDAVFLHSFSELRPSVAQWLHRAYVHLAYGHRTGSYVPAYHGEARVRGLAERAGHRDLAFVRDRRMSFGTFVTRGLGGA